MKGRKLKEASKKEIFEIVGPASFYLFFLPAIEPRGWTSKSQHGAYDTQQLPLSPYHMQQHTILQRGFEMRFYK